MPAEAGVTAAVFPISGSGHVARLALFSLCTITALDPIFINGLMARSTRLATGEAGGFVRLARRIGHGAHGSHATVGSAVAAQAIDAAGLIAFAQLDRGVDIHNHLTNGGVTRLTTPIEAEMLKGGLRQLSKALKDRLRSS